MKKTLIEDITAIKKEPELKIIQWLVWLPLAISVVLVIAVSFALKKTPLTPGGFVMLLLAGISSAVFFAMFSVKDEEKYYLYNFNKKSYLKSALQFLNSIVLAAVGLFLDTRQIPVLPLVAYAASLIQLLFIYGISGVTVENFTGKLEPPGDKITEAKKMFLVILMAVIVQVLLSKFMLAFAFVAALMTAVIMGTYLKSHRFSDEDGALNNADLYILGIIFVIALFLRFFMFDAVPPGFTYDTRRTMDIMMGMKNGEKFGVFMPQNDINSASLLYKLLYQFIRFADFQIIGIRFFMVILSIVTIPFFFLLVRELYNKKIAITATAFFSCMFIFVNYSRLDNFIYFPVAVFIPGVYFLVLAVKKGSIPLFLLAGIFAALNIYTYHPAKMHPFIIFAAFMMYAFNYKKINTYIKNSKVLTVIIGSAVIFALPFMYYIINNYSVFMSRAGNFTPRFSPGIFAYFFGKISDIIFSFMVKGSNYEYVNLPFRPIFSGVEALFLILGGIYIIYGIKKKNNLLLLTWICIGLLPEIFYSHHSRPYFFRMALIFPALAVIAALGFNVIYRFFADLFPKSSQKIFIAMIAAVVVFSTSVTVNDYFGKYAHNNKVRDEFDYLNKKIEDVILANKDISTVYASIFFNSSRSFFCSRCFVKGNNVEMTDVSSLTPSDFAGKNKGVLLVGEGIYADYFDYLKEYYPNMTVEKYRNDSGLTFWTDPFVPEYEFATASIPGKDIENAYGLTGRFNISGKQVIKNGVLSEFLSEGSRSAVLTGSIIIPEYAKFQFSAAGADMEVYIDDKPHYGGKLSKGIHRIKVVLSGMRQAVRLNWKYFDKNESIPVSALLRNNTFYGVDVTYDFNFLDDTLKLREPVINSRIYWFKPRMKVKNDDQFNITFDGYYKADVAGKYTFIFETSKEFCNSVKLNGKQMVEYYDGSFREKALELNSGLHKIEITSLSRLIQSPGGIYFRLKVKKPGESEFTAVKYNELMPYPGN